MFLANSLQEKLKKNLLENDGELISNVRFPYQIKEKDPRIFVSCRREPIRNLNAMDKSEWEKTFNVNQLKKTWESKAEIDFETKFKKFPDDLIPQTAKEAKNFVGDLIDPDILEVKQKRWNKSSNRQEPCRTELKQTVFEVNHGLKDFKVVPLKVPIVQEGVDSRNHWQIRGNSWNTSSKFESEEKSFNESELKQNSIENSVKYWKENDENRRQCLPFAVSEDRKKLEVIRYFKKYRTPYQNSKDLYNTMNKVKDLTHIERAQVEEEIKYKNPGNQYKEKIDGLVFKEMYNIYKYKYNELTGRLDKKEIKRRQLEQNKFRWNDRDLVNKILMINSIDKKSLDWFNPEYAGNVSLSQQNLKKELLKPLVPQGNEIYLEEEKKKEKAEEDLKKQQKKELLLKQKCFPKSTRVSTDISKFPMTEDQYTEILNERKLEIEHDPEWERKQKKPLYQINSDLDNYFLDSYKKIAEVSTANKNKVYRKNKNYIDYEFSHPGTYREFDFRPQQPKKRVLQIQKNDDEQITTDNDGINTNTNTNGNGYVNTADQAGLPMISYSNEKIDKNNVLKAWSCCMNMDEKSKGCQRKVIKKFKWLFDE